MTLNHTIDRLLAVKDYDAFVDLSLELGCDDEKALFEFLFCQAISGGRTGDIAARLLIEIEPAPTRSCEELLDDVAKSQWDVSAKEVPFFFISQFGKRGLLESYGAFIKNSVLNDEQKLRVGTIIYWTAGPTANLVRAYHDWPWREADDLT